jgi:multiple sugar transport system substrate-binding protein
VNQEGTPPGDGAVSDAVRGLLSGQLSRREFILRATFLGLTGGAIGAILAACSPAATSTPSAAASVAASAAASGAASVAPSAAAAFDPMKYAGTKLSILMTGSENDHRALGDKVAQLKDETGIELSISAPALNDLIPKTGQELAAPQSAFEIINYLGFLTTGYMKNGSFLQLNSFKDDPAETPPDWDFADFATANLNNVGIFDPATNAIGTGSNLYGIPGLHSGSVVYFYRKDLFDAAGLQPAKTWDDFKAAAVKLNKPGEVAGCSFIGANDFSLATVSWYTTFLTTGGKLMTGSPATKDFKPNLNSPEAVGALQYLIDLLPYAPKNVTAYGFPENVDGFSSGKIAQMVFWSTIAGPVFNPDTSKVADKTGVTPVPAAPGQTSQAILGGWGVGIPKNVDPAKSAAAWRAITWLTSKALNSYEAEQYQIDPSRNSTYNDPALVAKFPYLPISGAANAGAHTIETSVLDDFFGMNASMNVEFNKALIGGQDAKTACANVQKLWETSLRKAGVLA